MQAILTFVEWSHGSMEGTKYDKVILSDGLLALKVNNKTGDDETLADLKEGQSVMCEFKLRGSKDLSPKLELTSITPN